jgi:hypothetical protein
LQRYFENPFLDKKSYEGLRALLDVWAEISRLEQVIAEQNRRREQTYKSQEQIQKNMAALSKEGEEGRLRGRYVKQLNSAEEVLAEVDQISTRTMAEIEQKQKQIQQMIAALGTP